MQATPASRRLRRTAAALVVFGAVALGPTARSAGAGGAGPTVDAAALDGTRQVLVRCDGSQEVNTTQGFLSVRRTGDTSTELAVAVTYGGTLVPGDDYAALPDPVVIPAGSDARILEISPSRAGTVSVSIDASAGYAVGVGTAEVSVVDQVTESACDEIERVTSVGGVPDAIDVYGIYGGALADGTLVVTGSQPPGLSFAADGSWTGRASDVGTFTMVASYCIGSTTCVLDLTITVTVTERSTPAAAVPATPSYTG